MKIKLTVGICSLNLHNFTKRQYPCNTPIVTLV